jgi:translocation-and-assembly-module (TAM) inner membrane subunit TamB-like protein
MRRLLRVLNVVAMILVVAVTLVIVTTITVETPWGKQWLRSYIVRLLNDRLNATLSIGRLSGNLYRGVQLEDVRVVMDGLPVIVIDKVSATYSIRDMISKGIVIDRVDVTRPVVAMHHDDKGWDLGRFIKNRKETQPDTERRPITISQITIDGGAFSMTQTGRKTVALESIQAALALRYRTRDFTFDIARLSFASRNPDIVVSHAIGLVELREDDLQLGGVSIRTAESSLKVNGTIRKYRSAPVLALHVHSDPLSLPEVRRVFPGMTTTKLQPAVDVRLDGPLDRLETDFSLQSSAGGVVAKGVTHGTDRDRSFEGRVSMQRLNLSQFLDNQDWRSDIDANATVKLRVSPPAGGGQAGSFLDSLHGDIDLSGPKIHVRDVVVDNIRSKATLNGRVVELGRFEARAFGLPTTATGTVTLPGGDHHEVNFDLKGRVSDVNLARLPVWMRVPPAESRLAGTYHVTGTVPIGRPGTQVDGETTFEPSTVAGTTLERGSTATFHVLAGDLGELRFKVDGQVADLDLRRIGDEFHIQTIATNRYRSAINGHITATVHGWDLDTMELAATGTAVRSSMFSGSFPQVSFDTTIRGGTLRVKASGQVDQVDLGIAADRPSLKGSVTGTVDTDITFAHVSSGVTIDSVDAELTADLGPSSAGDVSIDRGFITGEYHKGFADIQQLDVAGSDITATGNGTLAFTDQGTSGFWIHAHAARLEAIESVTKRPLTGIATVDAVISGNRQLFIANGDLTGDGIKYERFGALTLASKFTAKIPDLDWQQATATADSTATFVDIPGLRINEVKAHTEVAGRHVLFDLTGSQPQRTLTAAGSADLGRDEQVVQLERLQFDTHDMTWKAEAGHQPTITVVHGPTGIAVTDFDLINGDQRISAEGRFGGPTDKLTLGLDNVDVGLIDAWLMRAPQLAGRMNARAEITGTPQAPVVDTEFKVANGKFRDVAYASFAGMLRYSRDSADVDVQLQQNAAQALTVKGHVPFAAFRENKQSGDRFDLHVESTPIDLGLVQGLTPAVTRVKGTLQAKFDVTGASDDPRLAGTITVKDGAFRVEDTGVSYTGLDGRIDLLPDRVHIDDLHVLDNQNQQLSASGDLNVSRLQVGDVNLYFSTTDFKVLDNEMGNLRLNSDLRLTGTLASPRIEGELDISTGAINLDAVLARIGSSPYATTASEAPGTLTGEENVETESSWRRPQLAVHLVIPNNLVIKAQDVRTSSQALGLGTVNLTLGGDLNLGAKPGEPMTVVGAVNTIRGFYDFQGRRFQILRDGTVRFEGEPITQLDPALNVTGERVIQAVTAHVNIRGRLRKPEVELTSVPPLEQSDILALIVFNQPLNQLGTGQQASLAQRAGAMAAGAVSSQLTSSVATSLGVDQLEINVAPAIGVTAEVVVGQQLSQNLYVKLQQELGDRSQTNVILEYEFTKWLRLQTNLLQGSSASQQPFQRIRSTGIDLVFTFTFK